MLLNPSQYPPLIDAFEESCGTVLPLHFLLHGPVKVYATSPDAVSTAVIFADMPHPVVFGVLGDVDVLADLLREVGPREELWVRSEQADEGIAAVKAAYGIDLKADTIEQKDLAEAPPVPDSPGFEVRRLSESDLPALEGMAGELQWPSNGWQTWPRVLEKGAAVGAITGGKIVSIATTYGISRRYADIAVATHSDVQGKGLCTACAATLIPEIFAMGVTPVWTVHMANKASHRVSQKLGFTTRFNAAYLSVGSGN